jgi:hypothetical protein
MMTEDEGRKTYKKNLETRAQGRNKVGRPQDQLRQKAEKRRILWKEERRLAEDKNS